MTRIAFSFVSLMVSVYCLPVEAVVVYNFIETGTNTNLAELKVGARSVVVPDILSLKVDPIFGFGNGNLVNSPNGFFQFLAGSEILDDGQGGLSGDLAVTTLEGVQFNPPGGGIKLFADFASQVGADGIGDSFGIRNGNWQLTAIPEPTSAGLVLIASAMVMNSRRRRF